MDLQKALCMLHRADPIFFEWVNSPIVYKTSEQWKKINEKINEKINDYFSLKREFCYYFNMAKNNYKLCLKTDLVNLKNLLYLLRAIVACKWLVLKNSLPPVEFEKLADDIRMFQNYELKSSIFNLIEMKRTSVEGVRLIDKGTIIDEYIKNQFAILNNTVNSMKYMPERIKKSCDELDKLFYDILINS